MANILNPITNAQALAVDASTEPEKRVKAMFHVWLATYFKGVAFQTLAAGGGQETRTFPRCDLRWQEADATDAPDPSGERRPQVRPIIHGMLVTDQNRGYADGLFTGNEVNRTLQFTVKVPSNVTGTGEMAGRDPVELVASVADNLAWLLRSTERAALAAVGVENVQLRSGPVAVSAGRWMARLLVVSCTTRVMTPRGQ